MKPKRKSKPHIDKTVTLVCVGTVYADKVRKMWGVRFDLMKRKEVVCSIENENFFLSRFNAENLVYQAENFVKNPFVGRYVPKKNEKFSDYYQ